MNVMKKLRRDADSDRGAVMIWFAASVVVSLGMGALVIDMGALWTERRQLQNGADASALAVAIECAEGMCPAAQQIAQDYADLNASDGNSSIDSICGLAFPHLVACASQPAEVPTSAHGFVEVITGTRNGPGSSQDELKYLLAPVLDGTNTGKHVTARAVAIWGSPKRGKILAMSLSKCTFNPAWIDANGVANFGNANIATTIHDGTVCAAGYPNGFDFLQDGDGDCLANVDRGDGTIRLPKRNEGMLPACKAIIEDSITNQEPILIPIAIDRTPPGGTTLVTVDGFALVTMCGIRIPGLRINSCGFPCPTNQPGQVICGRFTAGTLTDSEVGSGDNYGARAVQLIG